MIFPSKIKQTLFAVGTKVCTALLLFILFQSALPGQSTYEQKISNIDNEIGNLRSELKKMKIREGDFFAEVENIDKEVILLSKKLQITRQEEVEVDSRVSQTKNTIKNLHREVDKLQEAYEKQAVNAYIFSRRKKDWLIFDWHEPLESMRRARYFEIVARHEYQLSIELFKKNDQLLAEQKVLDRQKAEKHNLVTNITGQLAEMTNIRNDKRDLIRKLRKNSHSRELAIKKLEDSRGRLLAEIARFEREKNKSGKNSTVRAREWIDVKGTFTRNKGKLNWPVSGKVTTRFGKYKDPVLKTVLKNTGIDIAADFGKPVKTVYRGQVSLITFLSGFGNTMIIDHGNGFYSVYSHLNEIYVHQNDVVEAGIVIATVGDSGSLSGPKLHFEIYAKQKPVNPLSWLRK